MRSGGVVQPVGRISSPSASSGRPAQRRTPGVADRRAINACIGVPSTGVIVPRASEVRIGGDVGHVHHRPDGRLGGGEGVDHLGLRTGRAPVGHDRFELVAVLRPTGEPGEPLVVADAEQRHAREPRPNRWTSTPPPTCRRCTGTCPRGTL